MGAKDLMSGFAAYGVDIAVTMERFVGDRQLYATCLGMLLEDKNFALLGRTLQARDYAGAFEAAHALKEIVGNLGLTPLYRAICAVVESLRANRHENLQREYDEVAAQLARVTALVKDFGAAIAREEHDA